MKENKSLQPRISLRQKIILVLFGLSLFFVLLEVGLRLGGFILLSLQEYINIISIKQKGFYRILCLGESTTAGGRNSYPSQLEEILNQSYIGIRFSVINKGIPATNTSAILSELELNLDKYKPNMVITMIGINDAGSYMSEGRVHSSKALNLLRKFKTYKLARLICLQISTRFKEARICRLKNERTSIMNSLVETPVFFSQEVYPQDREAVQSEDPLRKALEHNPKNDWVYFELGRFYRIHGKCNQAEETLKKAIEINPGNEEAYRELLWSYLALGKPMEAEEALKKALEINPKNDDTYIRLGLVSRYLDKLVQAEDSFKKALELNPRNTWAWTELGWLYISQNKYAQTEELLKKAVELNPNSDDYKFYGLLGILYQEIDRNEEAEEYFKKAHELYAISYSLLTVQNYRKIKKILDKKKIKLTCLQYPTCSLLPLRRIFKDEDGVIFVDNEYIFKEVLKKASYKEYFSDMFAGDFGHCTKKGNRLLAENIANTILKEVFRK